jgi:hypothetical protein
VVSPEQLRNRLRAAGSEQSIRGDGEAAIVDRTALAVDRAMARDAGGVHQKVDEAEMGGCRRDGGSMLASSRTSTRGSSV